LRDRIVAVTDQDALIKGARLFQSSAVVGWIGLPTEEIAQSKRRITEKFIEESSPQTFRRAAIAREQRASNFLRQFKTECGAVEIGEKGGEA
jgi:hypothetical protein